MVKAKYYFSLILLSILILPLQAQSVLGTWKTIDDETGKAKSIVEIFEVDGKVHGKITQLFRAPNEEQDPTCKECEGDRANKKIIGMEIIRGLEKDDDIYDDGTILDPEDGKVYDCKIWVDDETPNKLNVRGYIAFFFRTQTWVKVQ
jgi:uncharacterized protein (DUF2147 family)